MTTDDGEGRREATRPDGAALSALRWFNGTPALLLTLTALFWAGNAIAGQLAKDEVAPFMLVLLRWIGVTLLLWPLYGHEVRAHWATIRPALPRIAIMATAGFTCFNALFYAASHSTTGINIGILQGSMPMFVLAGAFLVHGTPVGRVQALGVLITLVGVILVATKGAPALIAEQGVNPGDALMLVACVLYSGYTVALRSRPAIPGRAFFTLMCPIAAITAVPFAVGEALIAGASLPTAEGWLVTLYVTIFPSCLAQLFFLRGVDLIGPGRAGVYINLVPIFAALLAVMVLGETFATYHAAALAMVLGGIWLSQRNAAG
ncbi:MAG: DMT family transporter [Pseudomonadota bacterium]